MTQAIGIAAVLILGGAMLTDVVADFVPRAPTSTCKDVDNSKDGRLCGKANETTGVGSGAS